MIARFMFFYKPGVTPRQDGVEFVGSSGKTNGWDASTSAESERDGDGVRDDEGARVPAGGRTRGGIRLGGCARKHRAGRFRGSSKTAPELGFSSFSQNCPREDSRRTCGDIREIALGRSKYLQVVTAVGWSSMYLFWFCPCGPSSLFSVLGVV